MTDGTWSPDWIPPSELPVSTEECPCYKCAETEYYDTGMIVNNMEYHTYGQDCEECGTERTQYRDLGRKGRYVCPECNP